jgi:hypothetical protein
LEEYLETKRRRASEIDEVGLEGFVAEAIDAEGIDYSELGIVRERISSEAYFEVLGIFEARSTSWRFRRNDRDLHAVLTEIGD